LTIREQVAALYQLQEIDGRIARAEREIVGLDAGERERQKAEALERELEALRQRLHANEREMLDAELEMKSLEAKRKEYEDKMYGGLIRNPKELQDFQREVEEDLKPRIDKIETKILQLMEEIEEQRAASAAANQAAQEARAELARVSSAYQAAGAGLAQELEELRSRRQQQVGATPADLLRRYEELRSKKGGAAVVQVSQDGLCSGCRIALPADQARAVKREEKIFACESCGRILHWAGPLGD
jgi:hypothetical protein